MRILVVDDHVVVRRGLRQILADEFPAATVVEAGDAETALQQVVARNWDLVLIDVTLPGRSGIDVLADFRKARPNLGVIVLSMHPESEFAVRALKAGALGYLNKRSAPEELVAAARKVMNGERFITASLAEKLADTVVGDRPGSAHEHLSEREFQVLRLLAQGDAVKEIASALSLSPKTVSTYRVRVLGKLKLKSTVALARYALQHRLIK